jgi:CheY-like chemotaxis protein
MLANLGDRVLEAKDGTQAVEIFQQHQDEIRCVLSDLTMPGMDGWDTLAALHKLSPDVPVSCPAAMTKPGYGRGTSRAPQCIPGKAIPASGSQGYHPPYSSRQEKCITQI